MVADLGAKLNVAAIFEPVSYYLQRPLRLFRNYKKEDIRPDLIAGITVAVVRLPLAIAFAIIAELPPQMGLYTAIIGGVMGALWGFDNQIINGPTNALSLLVAASLIGIVPTGTAEFAIAAGLMAVMVGVFQLLMGLARLGILVNFVSHSVVIGFASGAGILIGINQIAPLLRLSFPSDNVLQTIQGVVQNYANIHGPTAVVGVGAMLMVLIVQRINSRLPAPLISMILASAVVFAFKLDQAGVSVIGQLPTRLPPLADLPLLDLSLMSKLSAGALAVGAIGLVQTVAISRSLSAQTGQRLDSNQGFVGQGMANIFSGLFSGYAVAASFSITAVNFKSGAKTPVSAVFSSIFLLIAMIVLAPLAAYLPRAALSGVLILTAIGMVDRAEIGRIWHGTRGDAFIMVVTLLGTIFLAIEFAVLTGILLSFALYIVRTSVPRVHAVVPDPDFHHFSYRPNQVQCPQLGIIDIMGDLYFGAVNHIEESILEIAEQNPGQRFLVIRMTHVNHIDFSGIHMLENVVRVYREKGGDVFLVRADYRIRQVLETTGFDQYLGEDHFPSEDDVISHIFYRTLDPAICIYECPVRVFKECQNLPKRINLPHFPHLEDIPLTSVIEITPQKLWEQMHSDQVPLVVDVREPREYRQGHIPHAVTIPLPKLLAEDVKLPPDRQIVLVCRSGRRSRRAAYALQQIGCMNVMILQDGLIAWEASGLLEAIGE